jgi:hypothetical protein
MDLSAVEQARMRMRPLRVLMVSPMVMLDRWSYARELRDIAVRRGVFWVALGHSHRSMMRWEGLCVAAKG